MIHTNTATFLVRASIKDERGNVIDPGGVLIITENAGSCNGCTGFGKLFINRNGRTCCIRCAGSPKGVLA